MRSISEKLFTKIVYKQITLFAVNTYIDRDKCCKCFIPLNFHLITAYQTKSNQYLLRDQ